MKIRPVNDRLLIRPLKAPERSAGGIYIPDQAQGEVQLGVVDAVGPGRGFEGPGVSLHEQVAYEGSMGQPPRETYRLAFRIRNERAPLQAQPGEVVAFGKYAGAKVEVGDSSLFLVREDELLAVIDGLPDDWREANKETFAAAGEGQFDLTELKALEPSEGVRADLEGRPIGQGDGDGGDPPPAIILDGDFGGKK